MAAWHNCVKEFNETVLNTRLACTPLLLNHWEAEMAIEMMLLWWLCPSKPGRRRVSVSALTRRGLIEWHGAVIELLAGAVLLAPWTSAGEKRQKEPAGIPEFPVAFTQEVFHCFQFPDMIPLLSYSEGCLMLKKTFLVIKILQELSCLFSNHVVIVV